MGCSPGTVQLFGLATAPTPDNGIGFSAHNAGKTSVTFDNYRLRRSNIVRLEGVATTPTPDNGIFYFATATSRPSTAQVRSLQLWKFCVGGRTIITGDRRPTEGIAPARQLPPVRRVGTGKPFPTAGLTGTPNAFDANISSLEAELAGLMRRLVCFRNGLGIVVCRVLSADLSHFTSSSNTVREVNARIQLLQQMLAIWRGERDSVIAEEAYKASHPGPERLFPVVRRAFGRRRAAVFADLVKKEREQNVR